MNTLLKTIKIKYSAFNFRYDYLQLNIMQFVVLR